MSHRNLGRALAKQDQDIDETELDIHYRLRVDFRLLRTGAN